MIEKNPTTHTQVKKAKEDTHKKRAIINDDMPSALPAEFGEWLMIEMEQVSCCTVDDSGGQHQSRKKKKLKSKNLR